MPREHGDKGEFVETVTLEDVLATFDRVRGPVILSADVADRLGCSRETARRKLGELYDQGRLDRRKVSRRVVYWRPEDVATAAADTQTSDGTPESRNHTATDTAPLRESGRDDTPDRLEDVDFPSGRDPEECEAAVLAARDYIQERGGATMRELVAEIMPSHSLGYDVPELPLEENERFRGAWWRKVVRPGLEALEDVKKPAQGGSEWRYIGEPDEPEGADVYDPTEEFDR